MCTFNGERFLPAQLESIAAQDRLPDELVVCDDGSSDGSHAIVRAFALRVPFPVRLVVNESNLGTIKNFEHAISLCKGDIVMLADQDDVWYTRKVARVEECFSQPQVVAMFSDADLIDEDGKLLPARLWESFFFQKAEQRRFSGEGAVSILTKHHIVTGATMAFRKSLFGLLTPFQDFHDRWLGFLLATRGRVVAVSEPLMQYRRHPGQQFGPGSLSVRQHLAQIARTSSSFYLAEIERFNKVYQHLELHKPDFMYAEHAQSEIKAKIAHLERRLRLPASGLARLPKVLRESLNGSYLRYSAGWKSIAKDLMQRPE